MADELSELAGRVVREIIETRRVLEDRIESVEVKLESFRSETFAHFDETYRRLDRIETEYQAIRTALTRLEQASAEDTVRREALRRQLGELKERVANLEERLAQLEGERSGSHDA